MEVEEDEELKKEAAGSEEAPALAYSGYIIHKGESAVINQFIFIITSHVATAAAYQRVNKSDITTLQLGPERLLTDARFQPFH